jgi:hypothetical protein
MAFEDVLRKVQALLNQADHPNTSPTEAAAFREKAEMLRRKHQVEEEHLREAAPVGARIEPVRVAFEACLYTSEFAESYRTILSALASHVGVRLAWGGTYGENDELVWIAHMVGFQSDIDMAQMIYLGVRAHFGDALEPKLDSSLSDEENVYRLRNAGMERGRIGQLMGFGGEGTNGPGKVTRLYKKACLAKGEDPTVSGRSVNAKSFREDFASAYVSKVWNRLWDMKMGADRAGGQLVLAGRDDAVRDAFYNEFPQFRPVPAKRCDRCMKAASGACSQHRSIARRGATRQQSAAGAAAGERAGASVDLGLRTAQGRLS